MLPRATHKFCSQCAAIVLYSKSLLEEHLQYKTTFQSPMGGLKLEGQLYNCSLACWLTG